MIKKRHWLRLIIVILVAVLFYYFVAHTGLAKHYFSNPEALRNLILGLGILAPIGIIFLQFFQTTISIVPSQITTIVAGFVFGSILGLVYSIIGAILGSMFIFMLARKYGKNLALKFFQKKDLVHFNVMFKKKKRWTLFLARMAPLFPNDLVSFGAGLTNIKFRNFNLVSTVGFVIQMAILSYFGSELSTGKISWPLVVISVIVSCLLLVSIFKKQIKKWWVKELHQLERAEHEIEKEFRKI
tara:strand:+ start:3657 stop:4382 length:726 start_codon:yes stop_codon:yes gene_type:complete